MSTKGNMVNKTNVTPLPSLLLPPLLHSSHCMCASNYTSVEMSGVLALTRSTVTSQSQLARELIKCLKSRLLVDLVFLFFLLAIHPFIRYWDNLLQTLEMPFPLKCESYRILRIVMGSYYSAKWHLFTKLLNFPNSCQR